MSTALYSLLSYIAIFFDELVFLLLLRDDPMNVGVLFLVLVGFM